MKYLLRLFTILGLITVLAACTTVGGLSRYQVKVLQEKGFTYDKDDGWKLALPEDLLFSVGDYQLNQNAVISLEKLGQDLKLIHLNKLKVQGHTDSTGSLAYNMDLSTKRATSVAEVLYKRGYDSSTIEIQGMGPNKPLASNDTEEGRGKNRRVDILVVP